MLEPDNDPELRDVYRWLVAQPLAEVLTESVDAAIQYVLDGPRTWRFDLSDAKVDSDERSSVGTKLQYHVIEKLSLTKSPPLDTVIAGVPVEIKASVRNETAPWMIPREGQCQVTILIRVDLQTNTFAAWLMRTHRAWLNGGKGNQDLKRSPLVTPFRKFALPLIGWTALPPQPLKLLTPDQIKVVFGNMGLKRRAAALFSYLPETVIPRASLVTVGAGHHDPMKRFREAKALLRSDHDLIPLVGKWVDERRAALIFGHSLGTQDWVAVHKDRFAEHGIDIPPLRTSD